MARFLYQVYARKLEQEISRGVLPRHVAVILDGNRRFAQERGLESAEEGHRMGAEKIFEFLDWCRDLKIEWVTLWLLSTDNLNRDQNELAALVSIIDEAVNGICDQAPQRWPDLSVDFIGAEVDLPDPLRSTLGRVTAMKNPQAMRHLQIAVGYGGREEITEAFRRLLRERAQAGDSIEDVIADLTPEMIGQHVWSATSPDPDLIIRTSGEIRLSGFLLWQSVHSEFYFCDPYWPEFRRIDFLRALREFAHRNRRFGR